MRGRAESESEMEIGRGVAVELIEKGKARQGKGRNEGRQVPYLGGAGTMIGREGRERGRQHR